MGRRVELNGSTRLVDRVFRGEGRFSAVLDRIPMVDRDGESVLGHHRAPGIIASRETGCPGKREGPREPWNHDRADAEVVPDP